MSDPTQNSSLMGFRFAEYGEGATHKAENDTVVVARNSSGNSIGIDVLGVAPLELGIGKKSILPIGDSIVDYMDFFGMHVGGNVALPGMIVGEATINTPAGTVGWYYNAATKELGYKVPGDTYGPLVVLTAGGEYTLSSFNQAYKVKVKIKLGEMPLSGIFNVTATTGAIEWKKGRGGSIWALAALTFNRFRVLDNWGIAGNWTDDIAAGTYKRALQLNKPDIVWEIYGTNDGQLKAKTPKESLKARARNWTIAKNMGVVVLANLISPRWGFDIGGGSTVDSPKYTKQLQDWINAHNTGLVQLANWYPNVFLIDTTLETMDTSTTEGRLKQGFSIPGDGLHDDSGLAYARAKPARDILNALHPDRSVRRSIGVNGAYSVDNKAGNQLVGDQGSFAGTTGSVGTGITNGTGIATGVSMGRSGAGTIVGTGNKVVDPLGGAGWQEIAVSGATVDNEAIGTYFTRVPLTNFPVGSRPYWQFEFKVVGAGCYGLSTAIITGAHNPKNECLRFVKQGLLDGETGILDIKPFEITAAMSYMDIQIFVASLAGATFKIWYRAASITDMNEVNALLDGIVTTSAT